MSRRRLPTFRQRLALGFRRLLHGRTALGIHVADHEIVAVRLADRSGRVAVTGYARESVTAGDPHAALCAVAARRRLRAEGTAVSIGGERVATCVGTMPRMTDDELVNAAKYEVWRCGNAEVDEVCYDSAKIEDAGEEMEVLLATAHHSIVLQRSDACAAAGLDATSLCPDSLALAKALRLSGARPGRIAVCDIGPQRIALHVLDAMRTRRALEMPRGDEDGLAARISAAIGGIDELLVCGSAPMNLDIPGVKTSRWNPVAQLQIKLRRDEARDLETQPCRAAVALGVAANRLWPWINLAPV